jgi:hypothetical protein
MNFSNQIIALGQGRVSSARVVDGQALVIMSDGSSLSTRKVDEKLRVHTVRPRVLSYAQDAVQYQGQLIERHSTWRLQV